MYLAYQRVNDTLLFTLIAFLQTVLNRSLLAELALKSGEKIGHLLHLERLQQITLYTVFQCVLRIFKLGITADNDKMQPRLYLLCLTDEINAVKARHPDIGYEQMRLFVAYHLKRMHTVACHADNLKAKTFPVNQLAHQQQDLFFIICQYDP